MNSALDHVPVAGLVPGEATDSHHTANVLPRRSVCALQGMGGGNAAKHPHPIFSGIHAEPAQSFHR